MQDLTQTHEAEVANLMVEREHLAQQVSHKESVFDVTCIALLLVFAFGTVYRHSLCLIHKLLKMVLL